MTLNSGTGGAVLATEDEAGVHYQKVKLTASGTGTTEDLTKAEDAAHTTGEHGIMALVVRRDANTTLVGADGDYAPLQVDANGYLKVEIFDGGDSHTIDGTVTANLSATDNAVLDNIQTAVELIDNAISGTEMQVDVVAALPTGSNTIGDVTVSGAALTAVQKIDDPVLVDDAAFTPATSSVTMAGFEFDDTTPDSVDEGDAGAARMSARREVYVQIRDAAGNERGLNIDASNRIAVDASGVAVPVTDNGGNLSIDLNGTNPTLNTGTVDAGTQRVTLATDVALPAGTNAIGKLAANSGVDIGDVDILSIAAGSNLVGDVGLAARTTGAGTSTFYDEDLDETKIEVTDNAASQIYGIYAFNTTAAPLFLQIWDLDADSVTVGTTKPTLQFVIPGNADSDGAGFVVSMPVPIEFNTGFTVACTTDSEGNGAPGAGACIVNILYAT